MRRLLSRQATRNFQRTVYDHYRKHGRDLPWRKTSDPYKILVSEIMLQQTQVTRVVDKYKEFTAAFPTVQSLARAPLSEIMRVWQGMGYNRRALALKRAALAIAADHGGRVPRDVEALRRLPGIGSATARSIAAFAFNQPTVFIETNIRSVFIHHFFGNRKAVSDNDIIPLAEQTLDRAHPYKWYSALMDYGVYLKKRTSNPSRKSAHYQKQSPFRGSNRQIRGAILKALVKKRSLSESALIKITGMDTKRTRACVAAMTREGILLKKKGTVSIPC